MTAVVCFNWGMGAVFVADSRLSYDSPSGDIGAVRDVCQKVWVPTGWAALGFAGNLCLGNALAGTFFIALRDKAWTRDNLLTNDDEMRGLALEVVTSHPDRFGDGHVACVEDGAALLFAYVRLVAVNRQDGSFDHFQLGTATVALNSRGDVLRRFLGAAVIGDGGRVIEHELTLERVADVANGGSASLQSHYAVLAVSEFVREYKARSVGTPFQVVHVSPRGIEVMPYFYWADVAPGYGTYVGMRIHGGDWVQDHRPSGMMNRIRRPAEILNQEIDEGTWPIGTHEVFDPRMALRRDSPGVVRKRAFQLVYAPYDSDNVPAPILESWGSEPLPPLTWAPKRADLPDDIIERM